MKPEQLLAEDLGFNDGHHNSDVPCAPLVQQHAKQLIGGSNVSEVHLKQPCLHYGWRSTMQPRKINRHFLLQTVCATFHKIHFSQQACSPRHASTRTDRVPLKSFPHSYQGRGLPCLESCPSTSLMDLRRKQAETNMVYHCNTFQIYQINHFRAYTLFILITLHPDFLSCTPSLTRSNTSLTSKLISSVSWPTYWYRARQRGPCGRGCGLGAGGGRWLMLLFLCFLWQRSRNNKWITADERAKWPDGESLTTESIFRFVCLRKS